MSEQLLSIGLAIVTKDRYLDTAETLMQLDLECFDDVLIVDDSESNDLKEWCKGRDGITLVDGPGVNMQAARNLAIENLDTDIITFLDDDVYCYSDLGERIRGVFERDDLVAAGGPCPSVRKKPDFGVCNYSGLTISNLGTIYGDASTLIPDDPIEVDTLKGANMSFRRDTLKKIGGFDTNYGGHSQREETDVFVRISEFGAIYLDTRLLCYHKEMGDEFSEDLFNWRFRNHARYVQKNFGLVAGVLSFFGLFFRLCGSPESIYQLSFEKFILDRPLSIRRCLLNYLKGLVSSR